MNNALRAAAAAAEVFMQEATKVYDAPVVDDFAAGNSFTVFKDKNGEYRWIALSSNAYRDRDGEIVSTKALADDVERADRLKEYGALRFWHMPGVDIGQCDFNMLHNKTLVESGTFINEHVAVRVKERADQYQISIGFRHPPSEPGRDGVFHNIRRFERSLVPAGRAANPFTSLVVKEKDMNQQQKVEALKSLLGDPELVDGLLSQAATQEKQADQMGIAFKEAPDWDELNPTERLELALKQYEDWEADEALKMEEGGKKKPPFPPKGKKRPEADMEDEDEDEEEGAKPPFPPKAEKGDYSEKMAGMVSEMQKCVGDMKSYVAKMTSVSSTKDDTIASVVAATDSHQSRIDALEQAANDLHGQLQSATKELSDLKGEQPRMTEAGYRPTQSGDTISATELAEKAVAQEQTAAGENGSYDSFMDFIVPGSEESAPIQPAE